jgi:hypothetical protein
MRRSLYVALAGVLALCACRADRSEEPKRAQNEETEKPLATGENDVDRTKERYAFRWTAGISFRERRREPEGEWKSQEVMRLSGTRVFATRGLVQQGGVRKPGNNAASIRMDLGHDLHLCLLVLSVLRRGTGEVFMEGHLKGNWSMEFGSHDGKIDTPIFDSFEEVGTVSHDHGGFLNHKGFLGNYTYEAFSSLELLAGQEANGAPLIEYERLERPDDCIRELPSVVLPRSAVGWPSSPTGSASPH